MGANGSAFSFLSLGGMMRRFNVFGYDEELDKELSKDRQRLAAIRAAAPEWKKELWTAKSTATLAKKYKGIKATRQSQNEVRETAEKEAVETVRSAVAAMSQALLMLQDIPAPSSCKHAINVLQVHNAIFLLKNKCGIRFTDDAEFAARVSLDSANGV